MLVFTSSGKGSESAELVITCLLQVEGTPFLSWWVIVLHNVIEFLQSSVHESIDKNEYPPRSILFMAEMHSVTMRQSLKYLPGGGIEC